MRPHHGERIRMPFNHRTPTTPREIQNFWPLTCCWGGRSRRIILFQIKMGQNESSATEYQAGIRDSMFGHYPLWGGRPSQLNCSTMAWSSQISCWLHSSLPLNRLAPLYPTIAITVCRIGVYLDSAKDGVKIPFDWSFTWSLRNWIIIWYFIRTICWCLRMIGHSIRWSSTPWSPSVFC